MLNQKQLKIVVIILFLFSCTKEQSNGNCWQVCLKFRSNVAGYHLRVQKDYAGDIEFVQQLVKVDSLALWHWQIGQPFCNGYNKNPNLSGSWIIDRKSYYFSDQKIYYINLRRGLPGLLSEITVRLKISPEEWQSITVEGNYNLK